MLLSPTKCSGGNFFLQIQNGSDATHKAWEMSFPAAWEAFRANFPWHATRHLIVTLLLYDHHYYITFRMMSSEAVDLPVPLILSGKKQMNFVDYPLHGGSEVRCCSNSSKTLLRTLWLHIKDNHWIIGTVQTFSSAAIFCKLLKPKFGWIIKDLPEVF